MDPFLTSFKSLVQSGQQEIKSLAYGCPRKIANRHTLWPRFSQSSIRSSIRSSFEILMVNQLRFDINTLKPKRGSECSCDDLEPHAEELKLERGLQYDFSLVLFL